MATTNGMPHPNEESEESNIVASRYKTKMCKNYIQAEDDEYGDGERAGDRPGPSPAKKNEVHCPYKTKCMFAHSPGELRTAQQNLAEGITTPEAIKALLDKRAKVSPTTKKTNRKHAEKNSHAHPLPSYGEGPPPHYLQAVRASDNANTEPTQSVHPYPVNGDNSSTTSRKTSHGTAEGLSTPTQQVPSGPTAGLPNFSTPPRPHQVLISPGASTSGALTIASANASTSASTFDVVEIVFPSDGQGPCSTSEVPGRAFFRNGLNGSTSSEVAPESLAKMAGLQALGAPSVGSGGDSMTSHPDSHRSSFTPTQRLLSQSQTQAEFTRPVEPPQHKAPLTRQERRQGFHANSPYSPSIWEFNPDCLCPQCVAASPTTV